MYEDENCKIRGSKNRKAHRGRFLIIVLILAAGCLLWNLYHGASGIVSSKNAWVSSQKIQQDQISQLRAMLPDYPELSAVIENSGQYPSEVVDLFLKNQESIGYLIHYPERNSDQEGNDKKGLEKGGNTAFSSVG